MSNEILMPELSPTMTAGMISRWNVAIGDSINIGDIVAEIETDKVTVEYESTVAGVIKELLVTEGTGDIPVGSVIATLAAGGELVEKIQVTPELKVVGSDTVNETTVQVNESVSVAVANAAITALAKEEPTERLVREIQSDTKISPIARRMAYQSGVDVSKINGSGERGQITKDDIRKALGINEPIIPVMSENHVDYQFEVVRELLPSFEEVSLSGMRKTVADRLSKSSQYIPHFYMSVDCVLDPLLALRKDINERNGNEKKLTVNDFIVKAVALALKQVPDANVMWDNDKILQFSDVDISIAVAIDGGLITPVVKSCLKKGLREISQNCSDLVEKAKAGTLKPNEFQGGTFTISNLGMFGIREFTSIINPPQSGILSVGAAEQKPVIESGEISIKQLMTITLAMDHRCVDGVTGARLVNRIKHILENPLELML
ncbi:pyruvate dehydrogenase complex dihydrolipoamide acetyltransferase [Aliikangiella sp. IMCC44359]|uniref:pyruvate dehydrogenase complex dihydrolipoamide acetyltransferase n=1 Tax=Aliikangiella sp. IMCC44359 TaxID=3459125 RepID=UPI00403AF4B5